MTDKPSSLLERIKKSLDDGLVDLIKDEQKMLANRLGADVTFVKPETERADVEQGVRNAKIANEYMHEIVEKLFDKEGRMTRQEKAP